MEDEQSAESQVAGLQSSAPWPALPAGRHDCYECLWQLELWLRELVYLELKSRYGTEWKRHLVGLSPGPQRADSRLTHMPTREKGPLSYITFDSLRKTISKYRRLFTPYLPVRTIWDARLEEISQIRNRVAHFRHGHDTDLARVKQLLRDIDNGIWHFCTSYNNSLPIFPPQREKVAREFIHLDPFPWTLIDDNTLVRIGSAPRDMLISVSIEVLRRPWLKANKPPQIAGRYGYLYDVTICARQHWSFDYNNLLANTKNSHSLCCHVFLDAHAGTIRLTLPSILGAPTVIRAIQQFTDMAGHALTRLPPRDGVAALLQDSPEYILGPDHPFSFLDPGMPCRMFNL